MGENPASFGVYERLVDGDDLPTLDELLGRPAWMRDAACREHPEAEFFPERGQSLEPAVRVCRCCMVRAECLAFALSQAASPYDVGVWGGTSAKERKRLRRQAA